VTFNKTVTSIQITFIPILRKKDIFKTAYSKKLAFANYEFLMFSGYLLTEPISSAVWL